MCIVRLQRFIKKTQARVFKTRMINLKANFNHFDKMREKLLEQSQVVIAKHWRKYWEYKLWKIEEEERRQLELQREEEAKKSTQALRKKATLNKLRTNNANESKPGTNNTSAERFGRTNKDLPTPGFDRTATASPVSNERKQSVDMQNASNAGRLKSQKSQMPR